MLIVHVDVQVKAEYIDAFKEATVENASHSVLEAGIARFDVIQDSGDAGHFVLVEVYRTAEAPAQHKETLHYQKWRDAVAPMMARSRTSARYSNIFPADEGW